MVTDTATEVAGLAECRTIEHAGLVHPIAKIEVELVVLLRFAAAERSMGMDLEGTDLKRNHPSLGQHHF